MIIQGSVGVIFLKSKGDIFNAFHNWFLKVNNIFNKSVKHLRTDNGKEFSNNNFDNFCNLNGIIHEYTLILLNKMEGLNVFTVLLFLMLELCWRMHTLITYFGKMQLLLLILYIIESHIKVSITMFLMNFFMMKKWTLRNLEYLDVKFFFYVPK